jgi:ABC-type nitrate/sulfonate/bicarbonate transport system substrate-binding protein
MHIMQSRRDFFATLSAASAAGVLGPRPSFADEGPLETTTIRLAYWPNICLAPCDLADDLLRAEGFTDIRRTPPKHINSVAREEIDFDFETAAWVVAQVDAGEPITALAGVHPGCYELFANEPIRTISDLKGKKVGIEYVGSSGHLIVAHEVTNIGSDRSQLAAMAKKAKAVLRADRLDAVADRGYFNGEEILACEQAGITVTLPKPMTSGPKPKDASANRTSSTSRRRTSTAARPAKS